MTRISNSLAILVASAVISTLAHAETSDTPIIACGELLPDGSHYSIEMNMEWDRRGEELAGGMSVSLTDERTGERPEAVPAEAAEFVRCVQSALGVPAGEA
ncbi:MAG: hypothetical protein JJU22_02460 [Gammaproteobacteria bacterium]|nr:hypothetical protein [Gammaproteobacteria bacterium]